MCETFTLFAPVKVLIGLSLRVLTGRTSLTNVTAAVLDVSKVARYKVNFKSSKSYAVHVVLFCDLNRTPRYGCSETKREPPTSVSPIREIHAKYFCESVNNTIQYSTPSLT